jgi:hypothetical protein
MPFLRSRTQSLFRSWSLFYAITGWYAKYLYKEFIFPFILYSNKYRANKWNNEVFLYTSWFLHLRFNTQKFTIWRTITFVGIFSYCTSESGTKYIHISYMRLIFSIRYIKWICMFSILIILLDIHTTEDLQ